MIPSFVVNEFLERKLDSHVWVKKLTHKQLDEALASLDPPPDITPGLRLHQKACLLLGIAYPAFCFFIEMGGGKTLISLELLKYWFKCGLIRRAIVFVTSDKAFDTWERQVRRFKVDVPVMALEGSSARRWAQLEEFGEGIVLLPYPGATAMCSERVRKKGKKKKMQLKLDPKKVAKLREWAEAIVWDESTKLGNHQSLTHKLAAKLREKAFARYALAGRPFGRDPTMLHPQYKLVDGGETLGETLGLFRAAFFEEKDSRYGNRYTKDYKFKKSMRGKLNEMIQHRSIAYSESEFVDLPPVVPITEYLRIPEETRAYYNRLVQDMIDAKGGWREVKNIFLRMRQLSSGFVGLVDDESGEKAQVVFDQNPKMDRQIELLEELPEDRKAVVFYDFTFTGRTLCERLRKELGINPIWLWSGTKDPRKELNRFYKDPECTVAVVNGRLAAMSIDGLQEVANYLFFLESPVSAIDRAQAEKRVVRDGQKRRVFMYDLLVRKTVDERIRAYHKSGEDLAKAILRDPAALLL